MTTIKLRAKIKLSVFIFIFISSWIYMVFAITDIYNKYEDNISKICVNPLISVMLIKFLVIQNLMILIYSFILFKFGDELYKDNRNSIKPINLILKYFIPRISKANYKALLAYKKFMDVVARF
jgi:hypothetical protein